MPAQIIFRGSGYSNRPALDEECWIRLGILAQHRLNLREQRSGGLRTRAKAGIESRGVCSAGFLLAKLDRLGPEAARFLYRHTARVVLWRMPLLGGG
jgi:hypothetical protein